jgi:hypothetical protein
MTCFVPGPELKKKKNACVLPVWRFDQSVRASTCQGMGMAAVEKHKHMVAKLLLLALASN